MPYAGMTQKEYSETGGVRCPACRLEATRNGGQDFDGQRGMTWEYSCDECGATWTETWLLTGYTDLERST